MCAYQLRLECREVVISAKSMVCGNAEYGTRLETGISTPVETATSLSFTPCGSVTKGPKQLIPRVHADIR